jgi:hypothetical protein
MKMFFTVSALVIGSAALFTLGLPNRAFSQAANPVSCGLACNVAGAGRSCPQQATTTLNYYCSVSTAGTVCGGPAQQTSGCTQNSLGCGVQFYTNGFGMVPDPDDPSLGAPCNQTYQQCSNANCLQPVGPPQQPAPAPSP